MEFKFSLLLGEEVELRENGVFLNNNEGEFYITNKRLFHVPYLKEGILSRTIIGYEHSKIFELHLDEIYRYSKTEDDYGYVLEIERMPRPESRYGESFSFYFRDDFAEDRVLKSYTALSKVVLDYKESKRTSIQYNIVASFEFDKNGVILIACPACGGKISLQNKNNILNCDYCGNSLAVPKKILDLI